MRFRPSEDRPIKADRRDRRVFPVALLSSVVVHALILLMPLSLQPPVDRSRGSAGALRPLHRPMRMLNLRSDVGTRRSSPRAPTRHSDAPAAPALPASGEASPGRPDNPERSTAELFRPRIVDPRLWLRLGPLPMDPTWPETMHLKRKTGLINRDAAGVYIPPGGDMSVWTLRNGKDQRWGLSPGVIHLGGISIPYCTAPFFDAATCGFGVQPVFRDAYRTRVRERLEIQRQGQWGALRERAREIRARLDSLRDSIPPAGQPYPG